MKSAIEGIQEVSGSLCVSRSPSESVGFRWAIRFESIQDNIAAGFNVEKAEVYLDHEAMHVSMFHLLTDAPLFNWTHSNGDKSMCTSRYAIYGKGSSTKVLSFTYKVLPGDHAVRLQLSSSTNEEDALNTEAGSISNAINSGDSSLVNATLSVKNIPFAEGKNISIDTSPPTVNSITLNNQLLLNRTYAAGDELYFFVNFNKPVVVLVCIVSFSSSLFVVEV